MVPSSSRNLTECLTYQNTPHASAPGSFEPIAKCCRAYSAQRCTCSSAQLFRISSHIFSTVRLVAVSVSSNVPGRMGGTRSSAIAGDCRSPIIAAAAAGRALEVNRCKDPSMGLHYFFCPTNVTVRNEYGAFQINAKEGFLMATTPTIHSV